MSSMLSVTGGLLMAAAVGALAVALVWCLMQRRSASSPVLAEAAALPITWNVHSVLNSLNKMALAAESGRPVDTAAIYLLADYLRSGALMQQHKGWVDGNTLEEWLVAHVRLSDTGGGAGMVDVSLQVQSRIRRLQAASLLRELSVFYPKGPLTSSVRIVLTCPVGQPPVGASAKAVVTVALAQPGSPKPGKAAESAWRFEQGQAVCELDLPCELQAA